MISPNERENWPWCDAEPRLRIADRVEAASVGCTRTPKDPVQAERYLSTAPFIDADLVLAPSMSDILDVGSIVSRLDAPALLRD
jgi:hypothetical protein